MRLNAERANAQQQQLAERQAALQEQRAIRQAQLQKSFAELDPETQKFPAAQHDFKRQQLLNDMNYEREATMLSGYGEDPRVVENRLKMVEEKYKQYEQDLKPVEQTEQYKAANQNWMKLRDSSQRVNVAIEGILSAKKMYEAGDKRGALDNIRINVLKPMSNMESNDAIAVGEILLKYSDLLNAPEVAEQKGKSALNPTAYVNKLLAAKSRDERDGIERTFSESIANLFEADPGAFIKSAITGANFHVDSYNKLLKEQVINTTSPGIARRMGAAPMSYIPQLERPEDQQQAYSLATPNPFSQGMPTAPQSVSGGAGMSAPANMQKPSANPLYAPLGNQGSTIFRIKR